VRVVIADDSILVREGIVAILRRAGIDVVAQASDAAELQRAVDEHQPDAAIVDIRMPPTHTDEGIRLATSLRSTHPEIGVVILSQHAEPTYATALLGEGSERRAYLLKERIKDRGELSRAVRSVAEGGSVIDPVVVEGLLASRRRHEESQLDALTPRELEILGLIAEGRSNAAIAERLVVTKRAVERHINGIFMKLELGDPEDVNRRVKAALLYLADGVG
jgi:DNA-binding NarL/FixJ family response regulator